MIVCILHPSCFCEIWAICVSLITYGHLYYAPCLACWALFGSLVPAMCNWTSCAQVHVLPRSHCSDNQEGTLFSWLFSWLHIYYTHLAFVRFRHCVVDHLYYFPCLACSTLFGSLVQDSVIVHHVPKCMSCHKAIVVITGRVHCFYDCIYNAHLGVVKFEHSVYHGSLIITCIMLLAWLVDHSLVHWYQQCVTVHQCPRAWVATKPLWW